MRPLLTARADASGCAGLPVKILALCTIRSAPGASCLACAWTLVKQFTSMNPISNTNFTAIPHSMDCKEHHAAPDLDQRADSAAVCVEWERCCLLGSGTVTDHSCWRQHDSLMGLSALCGTVLRQAAAHFSLPRAAS